MILRIVLCASVLMLTACAPQEEDGLIGYAEAELIYLAPQDGGVVEALFVTEGARVSAGDRIFALDKTRAAYSAEQASAMAESVAARISGDGSMAQQIAEAEASFDLARKEFARSSDLVTDGAVSREQYDVDAATLEAARARVERLRAERVTVEKEWRAAVAAADLAAERATEMETLAPVSGAVERIYRRPGEIVGAGDPVVALLAPENMKIRFFVPEPRLSSLKLGDKIVFDCDGCAEAAQATISFIASEPQYTPPIIYSREERAKLAFLVEARPQNPSAFRPGMPVTIIAP